MPLSELETIALISILFNLLLGTLLLDQWDKRKREKTPEKPEESKEPTKEQLIFQATLTVREKYRTPGWYLIVDSNNQAYSINLDSVELFAKFEIGKTYLVTVFHAVEYMTKKEILEIIKEEVHVHV